MTVRERHSCRICSFRATRTSAASEGDGGGDRPAPAGSAPGGGRPGRPWGRAVIGLP